MKVKLENFTNNDTEILLSEVFFENGTFVEKNDIIYEMETSKSVVDVEAPTSGYIHNLYKVGENVKVGSVICEINEKYDESILKKIKTNSHSVQESGDNIISKGAMELITKNNIEISEFSHLDFVKKSDVEKYIDLNLKTDYNQIINDLKINENSILVLGTSFQANMILDAIESNPSFEICVFSETSPNKIELNDIPIVPTSYIKKLYLKGIRKAHIAIGTPNIKKQMSDLLIQNKIEIVSIFHKNSSVSKSAKIFPGVYLGPYVSIGPNAIIGKLSQINNSSSIAHDTIIGESVLIADGSRIGSCIKIGNNVNIGIGVTINSDLEIGSNSNIVSGINLSEDVPKDSNVIFSKLPYKIKAKKPKIK